MLHDAASQECSEKGCNKGDSVVHGGAAVSAAAS